MATTHRQGPRTAAAFVRELTKLRTAAEIPRVARFFAGHGTKGRAATKILGVSIGGVFPVAKRFIDLPLREVERLLASPYYEVRMGAVSIMDFQARAKSTSVETRRELYELYLRRHDRIDNWDLVDRAAPHVVGAWLKERPRDVLHELARSKDPWERRTAIVATFAFLRAGETAETFRIAAQLAADPDEYVQKAAGSWLREAGKRDPAALVSHLEKHGRKMASVALRYATERLAPDVRARFVKSAGRERARG